MWYTVALFIIWKSGFIQFLKRNLSVVQVLLIFEGFNCCDLTKLDMDQKQEHVEVMC